MASKQAATHEQHIMGFVERFQDLQNHRDTTDELVKDVLLYCQSVESSLREENERLTKELQNCRLDLLDATSSRRELQQRLHRSDSQADWHSKENESLKSRNPYVLVLIDGDGLIFKEQWIKQGLEGGKKAAYALRSAIVEQCSGIDEDFEVVAKVVANVTGLSKAMVKYGYLDSASDLKDFTLGFTQAKASFDFIDVGHGKERADSKIRETTRWHLKNFNCKHIVLGVGHDAGYAPFLDEMIRDDVTRERLTVLEGVATVQELVATGVSLVKLDNDLFRTEKMLMRSPKPRTAAPTQAAPPVPAPMPTPPATIARTSSPAASVSSSSAGNGQSWANVTGSGTPPPKITIPLSFPKQAPRGQKAQLAHEQQMLSKEPAQYQTIPPELPDWVPGERGLDEPITVNVNVYETVKKRKESDKLCNNHFLRGPCAKGENCFFVHDYKPTEAELKAIAVLARQNPCTLGQYCEKEDCIYGHHCPSIKDNACTHPFCRFDKDQHPPGTKFNTKKEKEGKGN